MIDEPREPLVELVVHRFRVGVGVGVHIDQHLFEALKKASLVVVPKLDHSAHVRLHFISHWRPPEGGPEIAFTRSSTSVPGAAAL
ncbi:hypothetical protein [Streptomyces sp. NPDC002533]